MDRWWIHSTAISCAFASCAIVIGPGLLGTAVAHAGIFGIGPDIDILDIFGGHDNQKSDLHHPRPGSGITEPSARTTASVASAEAPTSKVGSQPSSLAAAEPAEIRSATGVPDNIDIARSGGGGGGLPRTNSVGRASNLPPVSSAPVTRSIVIRGNSRAVAEAPVSVAPTWSQAPVSVPLAAPPPVSPEPEGQPAPAAPPAPSPAAPPAKSPLAPSDSGVGRIPDSFRAGYAEYLRSADTSDLLFAAMPGVAGIAGFTLVGAYAGYRQARGLQKALLAPVPTSILL